MAGWLGGSRNGVRARGWASLGGGSHICGEPPAKAAACPAHVPRLPLTPAAAAALPRVQADRRALNITLNSIGTELTRDDRRKLYANFGLLYPHGQVRAWAAGLGAAGGGSWLGGCFPGRAACAWGAAVPAPAARGLAAAARLLLRARGVPTLFTHCVGRAVPRCAVQAELAVAEDFDQIRLAMEKCPPYQAIFSRVRPRRSLERTPPPAQPPCLPTHSPRLRLPFLLTPPPPLLCPVAAGPGRDADAGQDSV